MPLSNDNIFMIEYLKNVLYFATVRQEKDLKSTTETHYFSIDNELVYENYYADFGPLNLGCVYKYCKLLNDKLKNYLNKQKIVHYTSTDPRKKANAAFLLGCYGVLYLSLSPKDAMKPLVSRGTTYRPFQDATQGDSEYTISIMDCLKAIKKASDLGFFNFKDFNFEEYDRLDKISGGDLNWIVPEKFLAFIGPVDYSVSLYHPPEMYIDYFLANDVKIVIRLNKRLYDANVFNNAGIAHYDLFFTDGSCPPQHILFKFLQISEDTTGALAVHCKAGLGRTGSLIGSYLIKHYRMTAREAIGWMRICRPGSVIGHQQGWLEQQEPWLIKQGNLYRQKKYHDVDKLPTHLYGIYSIAEKTNRRRSVVFQKSPSPPPPMQRYARSGISPPARPQASRIREAPIKVDKNWRVKSQKTDSNQNISYRGDHMERASNSSRRSGAGEPRPTRPSSNTTARITSRNSVNPETNKVVIRNTREITPGPAARTSAVQLIKTVNDAKSFLMKSSKDDRLNQLHSSITVTPHYPYRALVFSKEQKSPGNIAHPASSHSAAHGPTQPTHRRRLGRSPSPPPRSRVLEQTRATNTPTPSEKMIGREASKTALREALSRLKVIAARNGSIGAASLGAASLGAQREAPAPLRAPSVRSDERPLATQGDMLNSIKFQRRLREKIEKDKLFTSKDKDVRRRDSDSKNVNSITNIGGKSGAYPYHNIAPRVKPTPSKGLNSPPRPSSPKGRRIVQNAYE